MSRSKPLRKFGLLAVAVFTAALVIGVAATPIISSYIAQRSADYAAIARTSNDQGKQIAHYRLALALSPGNAHYRNEFATLYAAQNNLKAAIGVLGGTTAERIRKANYELRLGRYEHAERSIATLNSPEAAIVRSKIALEQGSGLSAYQATKNARNDSERLQLGLSYKTAGMSDKVKEVLLLMGEGEEKRRLARAGSGGVALAQELYREGLYRSAQRVLSQTQESSERYLLLAHTELELASTNKSNREAALKTAKESLLKGVRHNPANLEIRQLLMEVYRELKDEGAVSRENLVIQQLRSGKL